MNIQEHIIRGILELLYKQDYLVVPGFGGFVLKSQASVFSGSGTTLLPPSKKLGFNKQLRQNDGILPSWLQQELSCDHATALAHLEEFADYCNSILNTKRRLSIERLGFFYLDFENNFCFEPRTDVNFLSDSFGLGPVHLKELETENTGRSEPKQTVFIDRPAPKPAEAPASHASERVKRNANKGLAYASLGVFLIVVLSFVITSVGVQGPLKAAFFNTSAKAEYKPLDYPKLELSGEKAKPALLISTSENEAILTLEEDLRFVVSSSASQSSVIKGTKSNSLRSARESGNYRIVFGCFSVKANARKFAKELKEKEYPVEISKLEAKDMYVVALEGYASKEAAKSELNSIKTLFPHAWIKQLP